MFIMFLDCASKVSVAPLKLAIYGSKNHVFTFSTSSLKLPADGTSYYTRKFLNLHVGHHNLLKL